MHNLIARTLRRNLTPAERMLWRVLRFKQINGVKFRRQHPIGNYVVDFVCLERKVVIELDGGQHTEEREQRYDAERERWLKREGYTVIRFWNNNVMSNIEGVLEVIKSACGDYSHLVPPSSRGRLTPSPPPNPPPSRGRETEEEGFRAPPLSSPLKGEETSEKNILPLEGGGIRWGRKLFFCGIFFAITILMPIMTYAAESGVTPNVISMPKGPGSVEGLGEEFEVQGNMGVATYGVAIATPEGSGGFRPDLKLVYSGGNGNSAVGFGWTMPLPRIQRQTDKGLPRYTSADTYIYQDGSIADELVPMADGSFRLKNEGAFIRAIKDGASWEVRTKSGVIYRLGKNITSRVRDAAGTKTFAWNVSEMEDTSGNLVTFEWFQDASQTYLKKITYNNFSTDTAIEIIYTYEARTDSLADYRATFGIVTAQRLTKIEVMRGGRLIRAYVFSYDADSPLSRLNKIQLIGSDGQSTMPPLGLAYTQFAPAAQSVVAMATPPGRALKDSGNALVDLNGDSLPDFIVTEAGDHRYYINEDGAQWGGQTAMAASPSYALSQSGVKLADLTGDGIADLVVARGVTGNAYFAGTGEASWEASVPFDTNPVGFDPANTNTRFVDLNGDRLIDVMRTNLTGVNAWIHEGDGAYERLGSLPRIDSSEQILFSDPQIVQADFNGDGLLDVARLRSGSLVYWPSMGYGLFDDPVVMSGVPHVDDATKLRTADLNGDGLSDIVYLGLHYVSYWLNRGDGSFAAEESITGTPSVDPLNTAVEFADMNGNGTTDIVWVDVSGGPAGSWQYLDPIGDQFNGLITRIDNGLGKTVTVEYESSTAQMIRAAADGSPWASAIPFPVQVIARVSVDDGLGTTATRAFTYRDGFYDGNEREFRGFAEVDVREEGDDSIATLLTNSTYDVGRASEALKGRVLTHTKSDDAGEAFEEETNTWTARALVAGTDGREVVFPSLDSTVTAHVEATTSPKYTRVDYAYDDYGNVTAERRHGIVDSAADDGSTPVGNDEIFIIRSYALNESAWILDRVAREQVYDAKGTRVADKLYYYDGAVFQGLALGQVDKGLLMREEQWLDTEDRFVPVARNRYDAWGNLTAVQDATDGRREYFYDDASHTFPIRERIFTGSYALDYTATYDRIFGKIASLVDPNNAATLFSYDVFGRPSMVVKPGDTTNYPTVTYEYAPAAPISKIATHAREVSGAAGMLDTYIFVDGLGRTRAEATEDEGGEFAVTKAVAFNARGKEVFVADPFRVVSLPLEGGGEGGGESIVASLASRTGTRLYYDSLGRITQTINPDGTSSRAEYLPLAERLFDENDADTSSSHHNTPTTKSYDGQGRLIATAFREGTKDVTTSFAYDTLGNLTSIVDPKGNTRTMAYDSFGRMYAQDDPNAGHRSYAYDDVGNLVAKSKPDGTQVRFSYEPTTRRVLAKNDMTSADDATWEVVYHYDAPSGAWDRHGDYLKGRLAWVEDAAGAEYYGYDARGNVIAKRRAIGDTAYDVAYAFDAMDRETAFTYPDSTTLTRSYNARGLLSSIDGYLTERTYTAAGQIEDEVVGSGIARSRSYDERRRMTNLATTDVTGKVLQQFSYSFDSVGNVTAIGDSRAGVASNLNQSQSFGYDDLYRLKTAQLADGNIAWNYDEVGNITGKSSTLGDARFNVPAIAYGENGAGPYAVTTHGDKKISYDANGNMVGMAGVAMAYDPEDRLVTVSKEDGTTVEMVYDFSGQRKVKKVTGVSETRYIFPEFEMRDGKPYRYVFADGVRLSRVESASEYAVHAAKVDQRYAFGGIGGVGRDNSTPYFPSPLRGEGRVGVKPLPLWSQLLVLLCGLLFVISNGREKSFAVASCCHFDRTERVEKSLAVRCLKYFRFRFLKPVLIRVVALLLSVSLAGVSYSGITGCAGSGSPDASTTLTAQPGTIYYLDDHLGNAQLITDSLGNVIREESRFPYGLERGSSGDAKPDYVYTGKEYDEETGLIYFGGRYYSPELGRWTTPDPLFLDEPQTIFNRPIEGNLYSYVGNNPISYIDQFGFKILKLTQDQKTIVAPVLQRAAYIADAASKDVVLQNNAVDKQVKRWCGDDSSAVKTQLSSDLVKIKGALSAIKVENVRYDDQTSAYAYVYANDSKKIYVGQAFFNAQDKGYDSKPGVLVHESTHFNSTLGTQDYVYGTSQAEGLAKMDPVKAQNNADNYEYLVESLENQ